MLRTERDPLRAARLRALWLYTTEQATSCLQLEPLVGYSRRAIARWFDAYQAKGLDGLLHVEKRGTRRKSVIEGEPLTALRALMSHPSTRFSTYAEMQQYLQHEFGLQIGYHALYKFLERYPELQPTARKHRPVD
jgi:transposase